MQLLKQSTLIALALVAIAAAPQAIAAKVVCEFNKTTGKLEPTLAWKNTLGSEADDACALAMQAPKNNQILSTPAMPGQASAVLLAGSAPVPRSRAVRS